MEAAILVVGAFLRGGSSLRHLVLLQHRMVLLQPLRPLRLQILLHIKQPVVASRVQVSSNRPNRNGNQEAVPLYFFFTKETLKSLGKTTRRRVGKRSYCERAPSF